ncbi:MAG: toll/interleukin-1 receptor domain-containing protein, partial [Bacteroidales bacterium]|nr:toll/interleukin-1 receptor domain-containing protein [Bacteroidales bacterium]
MTKNKVFISHSSKDIGYIKPFVEHILQLGLDIPSERIFCSSIEGQGIVSGQYIPDRLRTEMKRSSIALLFISKDYKSSEICLNEIGAAWVSLKKECVIPLLLPNIDFNELGILDLNRMGLKITERSGILKLIQDCKEKLNPNFNLEKLNIKIENFLDEIKTINPSIAIKKDIDGIGEVDDCTDCFDNNLYALDGIIRKAIPTFSDGIYQIKDTLLQNRILTDLSKAKFLKKFWYKKAEGDYYVERLKKLPSGNWLLTAFNWEVKVSDMWISMNSELQYEFILIHSEKLDPFKIDSDIGGESYYVGILKNGTIISENERENGFAIIGGKTINVNKRGVEPMHRDKESHWVFLVSSYHKAGYNADETIDFCKKLDSGEIEVNTENIMNFLRSLYNHPT